MPQLWPPWETYTRRPMTPQRAMHWKLEAGKNRTGLADELQTTNSA